MNAQDEPLSVVIRLAAAAFCYAALAFGYAPPACAALIHQWTFNDAADTTPDDAITGQGGTLNNGASIVTSGDQGLLKLDGINDYFRSATFASPSIDAKTLVAWVRLDNLAQQGGSALTLESYAGLDAFDAVVYGERTADQWMGGSDFSNRTPLTNNGGALETLTDPNEVMIAITYTGGGSQTVTIFRNGTTYASYATGTQLFQGSAVDALIGLRHDDNASLFGTSTGVDSFLAGYVDEARIYDTALGDSEIAALFASGPVSIAEPGEGSLFLSALVALGFAHSRRRGRNAGNVPDAGRPGALRDAADASPTFV